MTLTNRTLLYIVLCAQAVLFLIMLCAQLHYLNNAVWYLNIAIRNAMAHVDNIIKATIP